MQVTERLMLPFELRGHEGRVLVELSPNSDPVGLGHPLVAKDFDAHRFTGFPVLHASIDYAGSGLLAAMGWLQIIRQFDARGETGFAVDRFPLGPEDSPLYAYGYLPTFFDAPANPDHPDGIWQADTWLVAIPDLVRSRRLGAVTGLIPLGLSARGRTT